MTIRQITIGGQKYYAELNMAALEEFLEDREGVALADIGSYIGAGSSVRKMLRLLHFMMDYGHRLAGKELTLTADQLAVMVGFDIQHVASYIQKAMPIEEAPVGKTGRPRKAASR